MTWRKLKAQNIFNNELKSNVFIHWRLQGTKIFHHKQIDTKISNGKFFPNYGIYIYIYIYTHTHTHTYIYTYLIICTYILVQYMLDSDYDVLWNISLYQSDFYQLPNEVIHPNPIWSIMNMHSYLHIWEMYTFTGVLGSTFRSSMKYFRISNLPFLTARTTGCVPSYACVIKQCISNYP